MKMNVKRITHGLLAAALLLTIAACTDDHDTEMDMVEMPVYIAIPAAGFSSPMDVGVDGQAAEGRETRSPGDPGSEETFELPQYIYVYLVSTTGGVSTMNYSKFNVNKDEWKLSTADDNTNDHFEDEKRNGLYVYQGHLSMSVPARREQGRVYVAASNVDLEPHGLKVRASNANNTPAEITFNCDAEFSPHLKNLYSTPYNLTNGKGEYYGTIQDYASNVPHLDIVLYHTATKLDVQWQIDEECQGVKEWKSTNTTDMSAEGEETFENVDKKAFFSGIEICNLPKTCPLFMPMNCTDVADTYAMPVHESGVEHKGKRYNGRSVVYVIPRRYKTSGDFFMSLRMRVNNYAPAANEGHYAYIKIDDQDLTQAEGSPVHAPWLRAFVHVTKENVGNLVKLKAERQYE